jgi:hypothetical protein
MLDEIVDGPEAHVVAGRLRREARERKEAERQELTWRHGLSRGIVVHDALSHHEPDHETVDQRIRA